MTLDVESLYTNINNSLGTEAMKYWIQKLRSKISPHFSEYFICEAIRLILENNIFQFNDKHVMQIKGTAMGTKMALSYVNLVLAYLEEMLYKLKEEAPAYRNFIESNFLHYLDDCFIIWPSSKCTVDIFVEQRRNPHFDIKFTFESSTTNIPFLDIIWGYYGYPQ